MKILLVDDEQPARQHLRQLLADLGADYQPVGEASNGEEAVKFCAQHEVDVILMDIHMPGMDGLEAARIISNQPLPPAIIFTTAYTEHALSAFDVSAAGYLLKPIRREKLLAALTKATAITRPQMPTTGQEEPEHLLIHLRGGLQRISLDDVYYLKADNKYVSVRHPGGEALLEDSLKLLEKRHAGKFYRIHRNALVNMNRVLGLEKDMRGILQISFDGIDDKLEVSRRHQADVRRMLLTDNANKHTGG